MPDSVQTIQVRGDSTLCWSGRRGDLVLWMRPQNPLASNDTAPSFIDLWELLDGDSVLITNRLQDLPAWFQVHPSEVCNGLAFQFLRDIGERATPEEPMEVANVWRVLAGDYIAWIGPSRPTTQAHDHLLALAVFHASTAVIGQPQTLDLHDMLGFRAPAGAASPEQSAALRAVARHVSQLPARYLALEWALGD